MSLNASWNLLHFLQPLVYAHVLSIKGISVRIWIYFLFFFNCFILIYSSYTEWDHEMHIVIYNHVVFYFFTPFVYGHILSIKDISVRIWIYFSLFCLCEFSPYIGVACFPDRFCYNRWRCPSRFLEMKILFPYGNDANNTMGDWRHCSHNHFTHPIWACLHAYHITVMSAPSETSSLTLPCDTNSLSWVLSPSCAGRILCSTLVAGLDRRTELTRRKKRGTKKRGVASQGALRRWKDYVVGVRGARIKSCKGKSSTYSKFIFLSLPFSREHAFEKPRVLSNLR
jgi:hypothetical protein